MPAKKEEKLSQEDLLKLSFQIERSVNDHVQKIKEHIYDFVQMYVRRQGGQLNGIEIPYEVLNQVLEAVKIGMIDGHQSQLSFFGEDLKKKLNEFALQKELLSSEQEKKF